MRADAAADAGDEDEKTSRENARNEPRVNDGDGDETQALYISSHDLLAIIFTNSAQQTINVQLASCL